jgi:hypothetical protein
MDKKSAYGSGIWIQDEKPGSYFREFKKTIFWVKINSFMWIRDTRLKKFGSATLVLT